MKKDSHGNIEFSKWLMVLFTDEKEVSKMLDLGEMTRAPLLEIKNQFHKWTVHGSNENLRAFAGFCADQVKALAKPDAESMETRQYLEETFITLEGQDIVVKSATSERTGKLRRVECKDGSYLFHCEGPSTILVDESLLLDRSTEVVAKTN